MQQQLATFIQRMGASRDLVLATGVIAIIAMLILPMPGWLLDLGLALSITLSVMILMTALFIEKPLQLSAFPTILLIATMLRLGLNMASTRLILGHGHEGSRSAGGVIEAFGQFLIGGQTLIGLTIFIILVVINFVVITKGAGRIAEVAARFSLDAMPGKQMAIDADLGAGMINEEQARSRRQELEAESAFFGAMDGASKFVKGDAVAGLLITAINVLVGLIIGIGVHGVPFGEAVTTYTLLTVAPSAVADARFRDLAVRDGVGASDILRSYDTRHDQFAQIVIDAHLLSAPDHQIAIGQHIGDDGCHRHVDGLAAGGGALTARLGFGRRIDRAPRTAGDDAFQAQQRADTDVFRPAARTRGGVAEICLVGDVDLDRENVAHARSALVVEQRAGTGAEQRCAGSGGGQRWRGRADAAIARPFRGDRALESRDHELFHRCHRGRAADIAQPVDGSAAGQHRGCCGQQQHLLFHIYLLKNLVSAQRHEPRQLPRQWRRASGWLLR